MRDGRWECAQCGAALDGVPRDAKPMVVIAAQSGERAWRILMIDGEEIHRCQRPDE
jgi:hypothetical protein